MEFLAGNIEQESNSLIGDVWELIASNTTQMSGILGYKTPSLGKSIEETPSFILRSEDFGIVLIDLVNDNIVSFDEENEYWETSEGEEIYSRDIILDLFKQEIQGKFKKNKDLFDVRKEEWKVNIEINKFIIFTQNSIEEITNLNACENPLTNKFFGADNFGEILKDILIIKNEISKESIDIIDSILDGSDIFSKTTKKKVEKNPETINDFIKLSLDNTFKLDSTQRQIALQIPSGPQRIRGLAGTGKTIILCMKAALAHKFFPDMNILFVFNTQSMYNQVESLITQYYFNETNMMPDWKKLHIYHAWGGSNKPGVYYNTANSIGIQPLNYMNVRNFDDPLQVIYSDLLKNGKSKIVPKYDIVLIDEAQDFPAPFFETIYYLTKFSDVDKKLKRIVWAYDEFQSLTDIKIKEPEELFGYDDTKTPNIPNSFLEGSYIGDIQKDFVLPNSYRNPRINLMVAHGLALGLYSINSKMPMDSKRDWEARGYSVIKPNKQIFKENDEVELERNLSVSKNNLEKLITVPGREDKLVQFKTLADTNKQLDETILKVCHLIETQKVEPEEILIINLDTKNSKGQFEYLRQGLDMNNIKCITPGYIESNDSFKIKGFVTLSTPFRAKGNETNIVIILNSQKVIYDSTLRMRNAIFVSITRSRGWCFIYGQGDGNLILGEEITKIHADYPFFKFVFPSAEEIKRKYSILTSKKDIEKADNDINTLFSDESYRALLLEKISEDPKLLQEIQKMKDKTNDTN